MNSKQVRSLRARLNLTVDNFARVAGVDSRTVRRWEDGESRPSGPAAEVLDALEEHLIRGSARDLGEYLERGAGLQSMLLRLFELETCLVRLDRGECELEDLIRAFEAGAKPDPKSLAVILSKENH